MRNIFDPTKIELIFNDIKLHSKNEKESLLLIEELKKLLEMKDEEIMSHPCVRLDDYQGPLLEISCGKIILSYLLEELCWKQTSI